MKRLSITIGDALVVMNVVMAQTIRATETSAEEDHPHLQMAQTAGS